ncbi:MAG: hypothetical protein LH461_10905, partial [Spirochaetaceae bacterium]|nr:hypothetical protein [Spirochaetaceae bacterium]
SSFDPVDASCPPPKQVAMLRLVKAAEDAMTTAVASGRPVVDVVDHAALRVVAGARSWPADTVQARLEEALTTIHQALSPDSKDLQ